MGNIITDGIDLTGKTSISKRISTELNYKLITKDNLEKILKNPNIKDTDYIFQELNKMNNCVFDRHFMSILVYFKLTNNRYYNSNIDEEKIFDDFICSNKGSILTFRYQSYDRFIRQLERRRKYKPEKISQHDENLTRKKYFFSYSNAFHSLYKRFEKYNIKKGSLVKTLKQSAAFYWTKESVEVILKEYNKI